MNVIGYPQPGKVKSLDIVAAFCAGAGGRVVFSPHVRKLPAAPAAFYGTVEIESLFHQARRRAENGAGDLYYIDNAYLDVARGRYFRISRNALQRPGGLPDRARLEQLGAVQVKPWRSSGGHILVVEQSDYFLRELAGVKGGLEAWRSSVLASIKPCTDRPIRIRAWPSDKIKASRSLPADLDDAWAVVTHSSAAALEALLAGIPVFATGQTAAGRFANRDLGQIEAPVMLDDSREEWAACLAASQWTLEEMRSGKAWRALQDQSEEITQ